MTSELSVPHTPEEIAAAKTYLREVFGHASENLENFLKSPVGADAIAELRQDIDDKNVQRAKKGLPALDVEEMVQEGLKCWRTDARNVGKIVTNGSQTGERYLDEHIALLQKIGEIPDYYKRYLPQHNP